MAFSLKGLFKGIGKQMDKAQESPIGKALRDFGKGASQSEGGLGEALAMGGAGVGMGALTKKPREKELPPLTKPKIMPKLVPLGDPRELDPVEGITLDDNIATKRRRNILNAIA